MRFLKQIFILIIFSAGLLIAQTSNLKGKVTDRSSRKPLISANVFLEGTGYHATTSESGEYFIGSIPGGSYTLIISYVGYETFKKNITLNENKNYEVNASLYSTPVNLGQVTVTSIKTAKLEREVSLPVEVVTKNKLDELPSFTMTDILKYEPGVNLSRDGIWLTHVNIRGLSRQNVVTLVDGNRIETATNVAAGMSLIDVDDIQRIEVIKGGVSSLYGTGATGGVVNVITSTPSYSDNFNVNGSLLSSYNSVNKGTKGHISLNASMSNWYAKFSGMVRNAGDTETPGGTLNNSQFRDNNISAAIGLKPLANHELKLEYQRFDAKDVGIPGGAPFPAGAEATYPSELREMYSAEYKVQNLLPSLMTLSGKYFHQLIERRVELIPNPNAEVSTGADHTMDGFQIESDWYLSAGNRLIAGIDAWQRKYDGSRTKYIKPKNQKVIDSPVPNSTYKSIGVFAQDELKLLENKLNLTLGGRYDFINISNEETNNPNYIIMGDKRIDNPPVNPDASYPASEDNDKSWSANIGTLYKLTDKFDLTLNLARAFRSPTLEERYQYIDLGGTVYLGNPKLEPEKSYSFDFGGRYWGKVFSVKADLFLNLFDNLVTDQFDYADSLYRKQNIGGARLYGFDLSTEFNIYKKSVLYFTASYVRGEDTGNNTDLPEIPPFNGRVGLRSPVAGLFSFDLAASYFDKQDNVAPGEKTTPGYVILDLYLNSKPVTIGFVDLQIYAGMENILDKAYRNHLSTNRGLITLEPGRNIFAKVRLSW